MCDGGRMWMRCLRFVVMGVVVGAQGCSSNGSHASASGTQGGAGGGGAGTVEAGSCALVNSRIDVGEVKLDVTTQGCGPVLVMLHGFPHFSFTWDRLMPGLEKDFRIIRPNQRGYAPSDIPTDVTAYELSHLVADIVGLIKASTREKVVLVAHDWGGPVAWGVAEGHPELLRGLVVLNGPPPGVWGAEMQKDPQKTASGYINFFIQNTAEATLSANNFAGLKAGPLSLLTPAETTQYEVAWGQPGMLTGGLNWYRANFVTGPGPQPLFPTTDSNVSLPVLALWGGKDPYLLGDVMLPDIAKVAPNLEVQSSANEGHYPMYEDPDGVVAAIRAFVAKL
jgi:pimeloyl-ACP methyl ester carboxylesterase